MRHQLFAGRVERVRRAAQHVTQLKAVQLQALVLGQHGIDAFGAQGEDFRLKKGRRLGEVVAQQGGALVQLVALAVARILVVILRRIGGQRVDALARLGDQVQAAFQAGAQLPLAGAQLLQLGRQLFRVGIEGGIVLIQRRQVPAVGLAVGRSGRGCGEAKGQQGEQQGALERGWRHGSFQ